MFVLLTLVVKSLINTPLKNPKSSICGGTQTNVYLIGKYVTTLFFLRLIIFHYRGGWNEDLRNPFTGSPGIKIYSYKWYLCKYRRTSYFTFLLFAVLTIFAY
jgi:hypothetical protein